MKRINKDSSKGSVLVLAVFAVLLLSILGIGILRMAYGARLRAINIKYEILTRLTAEAGYEAAIDWMNSVPDVYSNLIISIGTSGRLPGGRPSGGRAIQHVINSNPSDFEYSTSDNPPSSSFESRISFDGFLGNRAIYNVVSDAYSSRTGSFPIAPGAAGTFHRKVNTRVIQQIAISGWDMGICKRPDGPFRANEKEVPFSKKDIVDMPIHINCDPDLDPDDQKRDIYISSKPAFAQKVSMGESRYYRLGGDEDKYSTIMGLFEKGGIYFDQPDSGIIDNAYKVKENNCIKWKVDRFVKTTKSDFSFTPADSNLIAEAQPAVQLEFYLNNSGEGMVNITNNCTVRYLKDGGPYDYKLANNDVSRDYIKHDIYAYHYVNSAEAPVSKKITDSYVQHVAATMSGTTVKSDSGGQIFVNGNVIIGGAVNNDGEIDISGVRYQPLLKGRLTVVATGNIWIANSVEYAGEQDVQDDKKGNNSVLIKKVPKPNNPNILALFSQYGVVQIVDPGLSAAGPPEYAGVLDYSPIGYQASVTDPNIRKLPQIMVVQAVITAGGGSWGAENIGNRKNTNKNGEDNLVFTGAICEVFRGVVSGEEILGVGNKNGYQKYYYFDDRLVNGIPYGRKITYGIPGDMWLQRKYVPMNDGGWTDSRL